MAVKQPGVVGVNTPVLATILPPPLTVHVPPATPPAWVNVTVPPPTHALVVVTTGNGFTVTVVHTEVLTHPDAVVATTQY